MNDDIKIQESKFSRILGLYTRLVEGEVINKSEEVKRTNRSERSIQYDIEDLRSFFPKEPFRDIRKKKSFMTAD